MEWINPEEKLPELWVDVLVYGENHALISAFEIGEKYFSIDRYVEWKDTKKRSFVIDRFYGKILYWMPLPNPPKE